MPRPARPKPVPPAPVDPSAPLSEDDAFAVKCVRYRNTELARVGCGDPKCALETCLVARHARVILRALAALDASVRTHT